jgi:hypothetical protein
MHKLKLFSLALLAGVAMVFIQSGTASAAFNANRLIDDGIFNNVSSMSAAQIDAFLNARNSCISTGSGFSAPDPTGYSPSGGYQYGGNVSAGTIIAHAAQAYEINPQVLITTLQKEQSLITSTTCSTNTIAKAVGYACPDSGGSYNYSGVNLYTRNGTTYTSVSGICVNSAAKAGFTQQLIRAAWLLKFGQQRSLGNMDWAIIKGSWDNSDDLQSCYSGPVTEGYRKVCPSGTTTYYDGLRTIDATTVHMDTGATAALYWYTPHLHGNQNFVSIFEGWFGSSVVPNYTWQVTDQYVYTDASKTIGTNLYNKLPGDKVYVGIKVKNTSTYTWSNTGSYPINVGTLRDMDRSSAYCDTTWLGCNRPARMIQTSVAPGETATFEFWMKAPSQPGNYHEYFDLVAESQAWFPDIGLKFDGSVIPPTYSWQPVDQYAYTDETKTVGKSTGNLTPGDRFYVGVKIRNTGNVAWTKDGPNPVHLGTVRNIDRSSVYYDSSWLGTNRPAKLVEDTVAPGQIGTFEFWMNTKNAPGTHIEYFAPVAEGITWMNDAGLNFYTSIVNANYSWQFMDQYAYTDQNKTVGKSTTGLNAGDRVYVGFKAKNTGNVTWKNTGSYPINVGMTHPLDRLSKFFDDGWLGQNRPARLVESSVAPGQIGTFEFWMKAPSQPGVYREYFDLVAEGAAWMDDQNMNFYMTVN